MNLKYLIKTVVFFQILLKAAHFISITKLLTQKNKI